MMERGQRRQELSGKGSSSAGAEAPPPRCVTAANSGLCSKASGQYPAAQWANGKEARARWGLGPRRGPGRLFRVLEERRWGTGRKLSIAFSVEDLDVCAQGALLPGLLTIQADINFHFSPLEHF